MSRIKGLEKLLKTLKQFLERGASKKLNSIPPTKTQPYVLTKPQAPTIHCSKNYSPTFEVEHKVHNFKYTAPREKRVPKTFQKVSIEKIQETQVELEEPINQFHSKKKPAEKKVIARKNAATVLRDSALVLKREADAQAAITTAMTSLVDTDAVIQQEEVARQEKVAEENAAMAMKKFKVQMIREDAVIARENCVIKKAYDFN